MGEMRLYYYAGVSTALAAGVVVSAFHQRANFYSACVYLAQSNLCLMILINLILLIYSSFMYGLQRLCFGPLRPIEVEQLYEKAWFAITETCLAMTIFREEVGAWFLVMFVALLTGKVWGWIGDGRVEVLEQQPPANPRLFHIRLSISLGMSVLYDLWLMSYTINTVIQQARPNMMVMFLFEFAVLGTSSLSTAFRYCISLVEAKVIKKQTHDRLIERRREVREERAQMIQQRAAAAEGTSEPPSSEGLPNEEDVDEMDIEVPGWEAKGQWVLTLDLLTDFVKLGIYLTFFVILLTFYGLPIHIMRDVFMTGRSFLKRFTAFMRYRRATQDMNKRYDDATVEDIAREDTCIICREEMRPWSVTNPQAPPAAPGALPPARPTATVNERSRPKKLPCGHILHLGCLKSWLERQQVCPTCRRPVVETPAQAARAAAGNANRAAQNGQPPAAGRPNQQDGQPQPPAAGGNNRGMRMLNIGPLRVGFGQANLQDMAQGFREGQQAAAGGPRVYGLELGFPRRLQPQPPAPGNVNATGSGSGSVQEQIQGLEQHLAQEIRSLQLAQQELQLVQLLQAELARLRLLQTGAGADPLAGINAQMPPMPQLGPLGSRHASPQLQVPQMQRHGLRPNTSAIPAGSPDLPPGVTIPEGWSLLPLERLPEDVRGLQARSTLIPGTADTSNPLFPIIGRRRVVPQPSNNTVSPDQRGSLAENNTQTTSTTGVEASSSTTMNDDGTPPSSTSILSPTPPMANDFPSSAVETNTISPQNIAAELSGPFPPNFDFGLLDSAPDSGPTSSLFSSADSTTADMNNAFSAPPPNQTSASDTVQGSSSAVQAQDLSNENGDLEQRKKDKGKARAASVEDTVDDSEV